MYIRKAEMARVRYNSFAHVATWMRFISIFGLHEPTSAKIARESIPDSALLNITGSMPVS